MQPSSCGDLQRRESSEEEEEPTVHFVWITIQMMIQVHSSPLDPSHVCSIMRFSSIIPILALATGHVDGRDASSPRRRRAQEVDNDVTLDDSTLLIEPIADDDPTDQPTMAPDFTEWFVTTEPMTAEPSAGLPTSALVTSEETNTSEPSVVAPSTPSPTTIGCIDYVLDFSGGDIGDYCHALNFEYEVETPPKVSLFALEQSLIPSIEDAIMDSLTPLVVGECSNDEGIRRLLSSDRNIDMLHYLMNTHRRAQIFGLGASPTDTRRGGAGSTCQSIRTSPNHRCSIVSGAITVCSTNFANDKTKVVSIIQEGMKDGTYKEAHKDIVKLFFIGKDVGQAKEGDGNEGDNVAVITHDSINENDSSGSETHALDDQGPTLTVGRESGGNVLVDDAKNEGDDQSLESDANADESNGARENVTITHPLQGAQLWGVLLGVIAAIFAFVLLGKKLAGDKEYDSAANDSGGGDKAGASETTSSSEIDGEGQV